MKKMATTKPIIQVVLPPEINRQLKKLAKDEYKSVSQYVRDLIINHLKDRANITKTAIS